MSVDFSQIINNFLSAELGEDVRGSLVAIAQALQDTINAQATSVTSDFTSTDARAAAQAHAVGTKTLWFRGTSANGTNLNDLGNGFWRIASGYIYTNLPMYSYGTAAEAPTDAYIFVVEQSTRLQVYIDYRNAIYSRRRITRTGGPLWDNWTGGIDATLTKQYVAADAAAVGAALGSIRSGSIQERATRLGLMKHYAFTDTAAAGYYATMLSLFGLEEIDTGSRWDVGTNINGSGVIGSISYCATSHDSYESGAGVTYVYGGSKYGRKSAVDNNPAPIYTYVHEYDSNGNWLRRTSFTATSPIQTITTGSDCASVRFVFAYSSAALLTMTIEDVLSYFAIYKEVSA